MTTPIMTHRMNAHHVSLVSQTREAVMAKAKDTAKTAKNHYIPLLGFNLQI